MTQREIQNEISRLQIMLREEEEKEREEHRKQARKFVGKCYRSPGADVQVLKIIGIPITKLYMSGQNYNEYQFPALFLEYPNQLKEKSIDDQLDEFSPLQFDTIYFNIKNNAPGYDGNYVEITNEEFNAEFDKCINHFKELIGV